MSVQKFLRDSLQDEDRQAPEKASPGESFKDYDTDCHSMVCAGCSCLCDDISYYLKGGVVVRTMNLCEAGWKRIGSARAEDRLSPLSPSLLSDRIEHAAEILRSHGPPLVLGADGVEEAAIRASMRLARQLQGIWLPWAFPGIRIFYERARRFGWATALLDEVRDHADLVIFWRADPLETHHRHLSRYSFFARGRFTERGNLDRSLAAVSSDKAVIEPLCQQFLRAPAELDVPLIEALADRREPQGLDPRDFSSFVGALERSWYIALFIDPGKVAAEALDAVFQWSSRVNAEGRRRMVILPLWKAGSNVEGFCRVSLEQNATPWGADFSPGSEGPADRATVWQDLAGTVGSLLVIPPGVDLFQGGTLPACLAEKPRIVIDPFKQTPLQSAEVVIPAALPGLEHDGVFFRADGLPLEARRPEGLANHGYPSVFDVLSRLRTGGP
jgi:formylmethanofuran dehydrogenase subunit B